MAVPRFSVCEISTLRASFEQDLVACWKGGAEGIGICEFKLPADGNDAPALAAFRTSGLAATICVPATLSVLPLPLMPGPTDPTKRVAALCAGLRRLANFGPATCMCLTGPRGARSEIEARRIVVDGLRTIARTAAGIGLRIGLEPVHASIKDDWTLVSTVPETLDLLAEVGEPNLGVIFDTWHLWETPNVLEHARRHAKRFFGVHINDRREPTRSWKDRVLPGDGVIDLPALFGALDAGGYDGWYDMEIFSDDGSFGDDYPDSLWKQPPVEIVRRGRAGFLRAWAARRC
ncbi:MAG: sugar phosphate isomerase/epimerase family protein [Verrucomicrobiota bacterium]